MAAIEEQVGSKSELETCLICATVSIGLEKICALECQRKLACKVRPGRGRIYFEIPRNDLGKIKDLRSVENLFVVVADFACFEFPADESVDETLERFYHLSENLDWTSAIQIWQEFNENSSHSPVPKFLPLSKFNSGKPAYSTKPLNESPDNVEVQNKAFVPSDGQIENKEAIENISDKETERDRPLPRFRVTCTRTHSPPNQKHAFTSMQAAANFGGGINDMFGWIVDLENYNIEVLLNIVDTHVVVGISLTKESLFRRNIVNFGPTTLKSTLAYCLALAAEIKTGDVVCDPLCGSGAISIECAVEWSTSFNISGDNFHLAPSRTQDNVAFVNNQRAMMKKKRITVDTHLWDACHLPLKTNSVDVFITDLPFGKKSGSMHKNWELYPDVLLEMARVCQRESGRAVILTKDKKAISKTFTQTAQFWRKKFTYWINIGGMQAGVYILQRTANAI